MAPGPQVWSEASPSPNYRVSEQRLLGGRRPQLVCKQKTKVYWISTFPGQRSRQTDTDIHLEVRVGGRRVGRPTASESCLTQRNHIDFRLAATNWLRNACLNRDLLESSYRGRNNLSWGAHVIIRKPSTTTCASSFLGHRRDGRRGLNLHGRLTVSLTASAI